MQLIKIFYFFAVAMVCGCGKSDAPTLAPATGTVLFESKPVSGATVTMIGEKGQISNGFTDKDGKFKMTTGSRPGAPVGKVKVGVVKFSDAAAPVDAKSLKVDDMRNMQKAAKAAPKDKNAAPKSEIPIKYSNPEKSTLESTVDRDGKKNVFEYKLVE